MFVLRFVKLLNKVAIQNRSWDRLFCIANLGLYKGCWKGEMGAITAQARIQTGLPPASLQAWARSKVSWLNHQNGANQSPGSSKRGIFTLKLQVLIPSSGTGRKLNSQGKRGPCLKASRHQARTPHFSSSARQPYPISLSKETKINFFFKKTHATHSHALVGNQEKFICVNKSNREQQNPSACPQDTLESGVSQSVKRTIQRKEDALAGKSAGQCRGGNLE